MRPDRPARRPLRIGIAIGDVNGIGPEVALKAVARLRPEPASRFVLIGCPSALEATARSLRQPVPHAVSRPAEARTRVAAWNPAPGPAPVLRPGRVDPAASRAAAAWIRAAVAACLAGELDALVTAPICKEGLKKAGLPYPGHTELLAELTGATRFGMLLSGGGLHVMLATRHVPLARVPEALTRRAVREAIGLTGDAVRWMGLSRGPIAVCGLNPHAGDGGALGDEERRIIAPEIRAARRTGLAVEGPVAGDTAFYHALHGRYAAVVAMYHDQGLAPLKTVGMDTGVNITVGLPIVRTSPDHGTAFDIAGRGIADPSSMIEAIRWAARLARRPRPWETRAKKTRRASP